MGEETLSELTKILGQEDENEEDTELEVEDPDDNDEQEEKDKKDEENEDKEKKDREDGEDDKEDKSFKLDAIPNFKEINKKYPNFFKDFPHFRHIVGHEKEYREIFPSVDEAREAIDELEGFRSLEQSLISGKPEDTIKVFQSIKELGDDALSSLSFNFLSSIKKVDQDLYFQVITPELVNFTKAMYDAGLRNENDNLKNSALQAALHFFGDPKVATGEKEVKLPKRNEVQKDDKLDKERQSFRQERYTTFYNDVIAQSDTELSTMVLDGMDPKNNMTAGMKELIVEKVLKDITKTLGASSIHSNRMNSLWKKAMNENFASTHKSKIIAAYLGAAKEIMPKIRAKVRANVLGIRERHSGNKPGSHEDRVEPKGTVGGGQSSKTGKFDPNKKVDYKKSSDLDIIRDNITYK